MNIIESVYIKGFWGDHEVSIKTNDSYNFIIGPNGSGKSTTLKLIAGVLFADQSYLATLDFDYIKISLKDPGSRKKPYIEVTRNRDAPFFHCDYKIFETSSEKPYAYVLTENDGYDNALRRNYFLRMQLAGKAAAGKTLATHLKEMVSLTWLSVQRINIIANENSSDPLDSRLEDFSNRLVRYLSALSKKLNVLNENFQEQVFLSLLVIDEDKQFPIPIAAKLESEKSALVQIFSEFRVDKKNYTKKVQSHFGILDRLRKKMEANEAPNSTEIMALFSLHRIESTVDFWEDITSNKRKLLAPRDLFISLLNELMQRKTLNINERNEIVITTSSGKTLKPNQLSSGEKQILIILGEALLQEGNTFIYMADEPEISLHVAWQETLAKNIKSLNPSAQIIFATHSPDVVGEHQSNLINMERCIK
ncbi:MULTISPECIES: AAA family ATPase [Pseudomonas]|jgi:predicted ATP-dependent endonuclease of OLD family|uniref:AAA family ATPase n=1 Tax=Pseudomonas TaxID=286 RepID=UPI001868745D|nr:MULTISPECIES: AAA family ATPase [Pseudomonas]MBH8612274.1 AAA family ATPase [Pseudomonas mohnii]QVN02017.1 AAA family ATPase [Pseudomonas rhodesiae]